MRKNWIATAIFSACFVFNIASLFAESTASQNPPQTDATKSLDDIIKKRDAYGLLCTTYKVVLIENSSTDRENNASAFLPEYIKALKHKSKPELLESLRVSGGDALDCAIQKYMALGVDVILVVGGTGISPSDDSPELISCYLEKELTQYPMLFAAESLRQVSLNEQHTLALGGRPIGGVYEHKGQRGLIFAIPGSYHARVIASAILFPEIPYLLRQLTKK